MHSLPGHRRGMSLVEVLLATVIVGGVLVGAMRMVGSVVHGRRLLVQQQRAEWLAMDLMEEILEKPYRDSDDLITEFGPELSELLVNRADLDDVDDFHSWSESPPEDRQGNSLSGFSGWRREVEIKWVNPSQPANTVGSDQGGKRVTVRVLRNGDLLYEAVGVRIDVPAFQ
jgi:prepilin-type N-terminal cleavage/methylation domain-containing protein